jgi:trk system potassium uptake protein TrkA
MKDMKTMKIVIMGCGRVGSTLAQNLDEDGHDVIIFDIRTAAFDRLPETFKGAAIRGDGTDEAVLRRAGVDGADIFLSLTEGDNRNIMAAQVAAENLKVPRVIAKINDPVRAAAYAELGLVTLCRTNLLVDSLATYLDLTMQTGPGIDTPQTPGHKHPHPSTALSALRSAPAQAEEKPVLEPGQTGAADREPETPIAADAAPPRRLGFRRWHS